MRWLFPLFIPFVCFLTGLAAADKRSGNSVENPVTLAQKATAATVGVYSRVGEYDRFYGTGVVVSPAGWGLGWGWYPWGYGEQTYGSWAVEIHHWGCIMYFVTGFSTLYSFGVRNQSTAFCRSSVYGPYMQLLRVENVL